MPLVSVIIPTYNRASFVVEAVQSVLDQTFRDFELIVVDDGSTDDTARVIRCFGDSLIYLYQKHQGVSAARNRGLFRARGQLIALLDSDDLWKPAKLEVQTAFFRSHPQAIICQTEEIWVRNGRRIRPKPYHRKRSGDIFDVSLERCMVSPSAVMFRRSLLEEVGMFDTGLPACEDYDLWLRVCCRYPVHLIPEELTIKRGGHPDQLSFTVPALDRYRIRALCKILDQGVLNPRQKQQALSMLARKAGIYVKGCLKRGRRREAETLMRLLESYGIRLSEGCGSEPTSSCPISR